MSDVSPNHALEVPVSGMDCASCARTVQQAITGLPGVRSADVLLSEGKTLLFVDIDGEAAGILAVADA